MNTKSLKSWQLRIFLLCWCAYACIYLGRNNLSIALPEIQNFLGSTKSQVGIIGGMFLWIYGLGQLINGYVGDKVSSRIYIFTGLFFTALANILFGFTSSLVVMCVLWAGNGFFQSMLWGPMAKTISYWFSPSKRSSAAIAVSTSMVGGTLLAYILSSQMITRMSWNWVFWIPGIIVLVYSIIWYIFIRNHPKDAGFSAPADADVEPAAFEAPNTVSCETPQKNYTLWEVIKKTRLQFVIIACLAQGIVKDSINLWAPTFFMETHKLNIKSTASLIIAIPLMNFGGMLLAGWINKKFKYREKMATIALFLIGIIMIIGLKTLGQMNILLALTFLGLSSAMMYGANTLLLGVLPMRFAKYNKVSSVSGALDFFSYIASGSATAITGLIIDLSGWGGVLIFWVAVTVIGTVSLVLSQVYENKARDCASSAGKMQA